MADLPPIVVGERGAGFEYPGSDANLALANPFPRRKGPGDEIHELVRALLRYRWSIAGFVSLAVLLAALSQALATPLYRSVATVQVELTDEEGANRAEADARNSIRVENVAKIYRSRSVAARVIDDLDLMSNRAFMGEHYKPADQYTSKDKIDAISRFTQNIRVVSTAPSDLLDLEVTSPDANLAARIANQLPISAQKMRVSRRQGTRIEMLSELEKAGERLSAKLADAERKVAQFRRQHNMLEGSGSAEDLAQINRVAVEAASAQALSSAASARSTGVSQAAGIHSLASADSPLLQQQRQRLATLQGEKTRLSATFGAGHPQMISLDTEMQALQSSIRAEQDAVLARARADADATAAQQRALAESERAAAAARAGQLSGVVRAMTSKAFENNANLAELARLTRDAEIARDVYMSTVKRAEEVRSAIGMIGVNSSSISSAIAESEPFSPKPLRTIGGTFLASLVISVLAVLAIELANNKLRSSRQIYRLFGVRTFGLFPLLSDKRNLSLDENPVVTEPHSLFAEVSRGVHAEVADLAKPNRSQTVLVTSALPGEGKSNVAISLCAAACAAGQRAIVVDFDLRRPGVMQDIQRQLGGPDLIEMLLDPPERIPAPAPAEEGTRREIVTYKPAIISTREPVPNPGALFAQKHVDRLLRLLQDDYDLVIINGPAALAVQDARTLSRLADSTLLVIHWNETTIPQVATALEKLGNKVDGAVLDQVDYVEHARCGFEDEVQFYMRSSAYYEGHVPTRTTLREQLTKLWSRLQPKRSTVQ